MNRFPTILMGLLILCTVTLLASSAHGQAIPGGETVSDAIREATGQGTTAAKPDSSDTNLIERLEGKLEDSIEYREEKVIAAAPESLKDFLSMPLLRIELYGVRVWQWIGVLLFVAFSWLLAAIACGVIFRILSSWARRTTTTLDDDLVESSNRPTRLIVAIIIFSLLYPLLVIDPEVRFLRHGMGVATALAILWLLVEATDVFSDGLLRHLKRKDEKANTSYLPMVRRFVKAVLCLIVLVSMLQSFGFNVMALVAGLGVGGLAVALAAQKTIENLFGGIVVIADRPVEVGNFCKVGEHTGTVEDIGLRSTRLRTLDRTVVSIPNSEFSSTRIENYAERDRIRIHSILQLGYDTSPDQLRYVLTELRKLVAAHPRIMENYNRVRFVNFGAHSLDIEFFAYVGTRDWLDFQAVREDVFLRVIDIINGSGAYFAYPSQTLYLGRHGGRNEERTESAEQAVAKWREDEQLFFPGLPPEKIAEIEDSLDYPPAGSPKKEPEN